MSVSLGLRCFLLPATLDVSAVGEFNRNHETNANSSIFLLVKRLMDSIQCEEEMISMTLTIFLGLLGGNTIWNSEGVEMSLAHCTNKDAAVKFIHRVQCK